MADTQTLTLAEFLLARITEDERRAEAVSATIATGDGWFASIVKDHDELAAGDCPSFVAEYDPAHALRECGAKRRIVEAFEDERVRRDIYNRSYGADLLTTNDDLRGRLASNAHCRGLEIAMLALASAYPDHPDYRPEWRA